jgi:hypothetical protein
MAVVAGGRLCYVEEELCGRSSQPGASRAGAWAGAWHGRRTGVEDAAMDGPGMGARLGGQAMLAASWRGVRRG